MLGLALVATRAEALVRLIDTCARAAMWRANKSIFSPFNKRVLLFTLTAALRGACRPLNIHAMSRLRTVRDMFLALPSKVFYR